MTGYLDQKGKAHSTIYSHVSMPHFYTRASRPTIYALTSVRSRPHCSRPQNLYLPALLFCKLFACLGGLCQRLRQCVDSGTIHIGDCLSVDAV